MSNLSLSHIGFRAWQQGDIEQAPSNNTAIAGQTTDILNIHSIKFRSWQPPGVVVIAPGNQNGNLFAVGNASVTAPVPTIRMLPVSVVAAASTFNPVITISEIISVTPAIATASVEVGGMTILNNNPEPNSANAVASISLVVPTISVTAIASSNASISVPFVAVSEVIISVVPTATASIVAPSLTISVSSVAATSNAVGNAPFIQNGNPEPPAALSTASVDNHTPVISITSVGASTASVSAPVITISKTINSVASEAIASVVAPIPVVQVTAQALSTASVVAPTIFNEEVNAPPATATASVVAPTISSGINQLSFPEDIIDLMWAGNIEGQSYDDTMEGRIT